eukprot:205648_1
MKAMFLYIFLILETIISAIGSSSCNAVYYNDHPIVPLDICGSSYNTQSGEFSTIFKCNGTIVVEEYFVGKSCHGEVASARIAYNSTLYTFDCNNEIECDYSMIRSYVDSSCINKGSYDDIPIVVNECSSSNAGTSKQYTCDKSSVKSFTYNTDDCTGDANTEEILYENGDCDDDLNNYYEISKCGGYNLDGSNAIHVSVNILFILLISIYFEL